MSKVNMFRCDYCKQTYEKVYIGQFLLDVVLAKHLPTLDFCSANCIRRYVQANLTEVREYDFDEVKMSNE